MRSSPGLPKHGTHHRTHQKEHAKSHNIYKSETKSPQNSPKRIISEVTDPRQTAGSIQWINRQQLDQPAATTAYRSKIRTPPNSSSAFHMLGEKEIGIWQHAKMQIIREKEIRQNKG
jgi:hypothetical protein